MPKILEYSISPFYLLYICLYDQCRHRKLLHYSSHYSYVSYSVCCFPTKNIKLLPLCSLLYPSHRIPTKQDKRERGTTPTPQLPSLLPGSEGTACVQTARSPALPYPRASGPWTLQIREGTTGQGPGIAVMFDIHS